MVYESPSFFEIWYRFTCKLSQEELLEATIIAKVIWDRRKNFVHKQSFAHPNFIISKDRDEICYFKQANYPPNYPNNSYLPTPSATVHCAKPPRGVYKIDGDATYNSNFGKVGMGIIIRDCDGKVYGTLQACSPFTVEALIFLHAIMFYKETSFTRLFLEGDVLHVIDILK